MNNQKPKRQPNPARGLEDIVAARSKVWKHYKMTEDEQQRAHDLSDRICELLRDASKEQRKQALTVLIRKLGLNIHDWVSLWRP